MPRLPTSKSHERVARRIFFAFLLAAGVPLGLLAGWTLLHVEAELTDQAVRRARELAKIQGVELIGRLNVALNELKTLASLEMHALQELASNRIERTAQPSSTYWDVLFSVGLDGNVIQLAGDSDTRLIEIAKQLDADRSNVESQLIELQGSQKPDAKRHHYLLVSSRKDGWIGGRLNPDYLWEWESLQERADVLCYLDGGGAALACSETPSDTWLSAIHRNMIEGREGGMIHSDGEVSLVGAVWPFVMGQFLIDRKWSVVIGIPLSEALAPIALFRTIFPRVALITLAVVGFLSLYVIRGNLRPLSALLQATRRVKGGSFDVMVRLPRRDEFQELGHAFNDMTRTLNRQFCHLSVLAELGKELQKRRTVTDTLNGFLRMLPEVGSFHTAGALAESGEKGVGKSWAFPLADRPGFSEPTLLPGETVTSDLESEPWLDNNEAAIKRYSALHLLGPMPQGQCLIVPAAHQGRVLANLVLIYPPGMPPGNDELDGLARIADYLGMALHKALLHEQLVYRAEHDVLTGLASRDLLLERFATYRQKHECTGNELAFVMVSIDNMKSVSDANGYVFGDQMLVEIGRRFCGLVKNGETLSRFDGGNFVALLQAGNGLSALDRATEFVEEIDSALSTALFVEGRKIHVSATKGGAVYPRDSRNSTGLLRRADAALHEALQSDRGSVRWFDAALERRIEQRYEAEQALRYAIERDELDLYYQPITDPYDGAIVGAESLIRWQRPGFGFVSPDVFIPQAEQTGLIEAIGSWTLLRACTRFEAWRRCGMELPYISVNVSGRQLTKDEFSQQLEAILIESGLPPEKLVLEVTETAMIGRLDACIAQLKAVRRLGVRVAIDDFGTGYASLKYVKYLPADMFKIDQLFVSDLPNNPRDLAIVSAVQELAAQVGTDIIVEGVETADQVRVLTERGIRKLQGYFYSKPLSERDFFAYLAAHQPDTARATVIG